MSNSQLAEADSTDDISPRERSPASFLAAETSENRLNGKPVQIVTVDPETSEFVLQEDDLSKILLSDKCKDRPLAVISIAGDFRKGKSFLLNFLLRYLSSGSEDGWLDGSKKDSPLKGFSWRGGSERDTTGILIWSEPFVIKLPSEKEVAILLMDTQGAFDSEYTVKDSATVFALSTMTSSVQVFNVLHNLQEDNLQVLQTFTEYGRLALEESEEKPFQKLTFLVRDWSFAYEHGYGFEGGNALLEKKLVISDRQPLQLQRIRKHIKSCFSSIDCFLMPHPGKKVATNPSFDGRISDIDEDFLDQLKILAPSILSPSKIVLKEISGCEVTGRQLLEYYKVYINIFKGETMPEPKSMLEATAEANCRAALALAKDFYSSQMEEICGGDRPFVNQKELERRNGEITNQAMEIFNKFRKMGGKEYSDTYLNELKESIEQNWLHFQAQNEAKNVFSLLGAPAIFLLWTAVCYMISRIFEVVSVMFVANLFWFFGTVSLVLTITYMFFRYGGTMPEFVQAMDKVAEYIWGFAVDLGVKVMSDQIQKKTGLILNPVDETNSIGGPHTPGVSRITSNRSPSMRPSISSASQQ